MFQAIGRGFKSLGRLLAWPFSRRPSAGVRRGMLWTLHLLVVAVVLVLLGVVNYATGLAAWIDVPSRVLRVAWLPLLAALMYSAALLGWKLWRIASREEAPSDHPEVDRAWRAGMAALEQVGLDVGAMPVFLVLGTRTHEESRFLKSGHRELLQSPFPRQPEAPLRVAADREAVYVFCSGISLLGQQADYWETSRLDREATSTPSQDDNIWEIPVGGRRSPEANTAEQAEPSEAYGAMLEPIAASEKKTPDSGSSLLPTAVGAYVEHGNASPESEGNAATAVAELEPPRPSPAMRPVTAASLAPSRESRGFRRESVGAQAELVARSEGRMRRLCELIEETRRPYCPINGVLAVVPGEATSTSEQSSEAALLLRRDLETIHDVTQLKCPLTFVVGDLEQTPGAEELLRRFPVEQRARRYGVRLPHLDEADADLLGETVREAVDWLVDDLTSALVYRLARSPRGDEAVVEDNARLYHFQREMQRRASQFMRILRRGPGAEEASPWRLGGFYLAATDPSNADRCAFLDEVVAETIDRQNEVAWTARARNDDRLRKRLATLGATSIAAAAGLLAAAIVVSLGR